MAGITFGTNQITSPRWAQDCLDEEHLLPGIQLDAAQFNKTDAVVVTVGSAGAAVDATTVPVDALSGALPNGTLLDFGGKKFARLTAAAAAGATSLTVAALATALVDNDTATYAGSATTKKTVYSGTLVGRTFTERTAGTPFGPAASTDDEIFLTAFDVYDLDTDNTASPVRGRTAIYENFLPNYTTIAANTALLAKLRALYDTMIGVA